MVKSAFCGVLWHHTTDTHLPDWHGRRYQATWKYFVSCLRESTSRMRPFKCRFLHSRIGITTLIDFCLIRATSVCHCQDLHLKPLLVKSHKCTHVTHAKHMFIYNGLRPPSWHMFSSWMDIYIYVWQQNYHAICSDVASYVLIYLHRIERLVVTRKLLTAWLGAHTVRYLKPPPTFCLRIAYHWPPMTSEYEHIEQQRTVV